jgi:prepilin-type N-terminal cleavage/methylation domain-containing protein
MHNLPCSKKAFTLMELMIVIAVIGILAASLFPSMGNYFERSKTAKIYSQIEELRTMSVVYYSDH